MFCGECYNAFPKIDTSVFSGLRYFWTLSIAQYYENNTVFRKLELLVIRQLLKCIP